MTEIGRHSAAVLILLSLLLMGCRQKMADQPRYESYEASGLFPDSLSMRHPVAGTVPREATLDRAYEPRHTHEDGFPFSGEEHAHGSNQSGYPFLITREALERGRQRYEIYCSPCHGRAGYGEGIIVQRGLRRPPSFHTDRLRALPPSHFYEVVTNGFGAMYSYASRVAHADRWAIAAYIQALQLSQRAEIAAVPPDTLDRLERR